ncbi:MAG: diacylglycerol kinase [Granulosicoccus sp.]
MKNEATGINRLVTAFGFSIKGLKTAYRYETAFRQEVWAAIALLPLAFVVGDGVLEIAILTGSVLLLMIVELLNTAVENVVDRIGEEFHELSGRAKDTGSAAVLLTIVLVAITWIAIGLK